MSHPAVVHPKAFVMTLKSLNKASKVLRFSYPFPSSDRQTTHTHTHTHTPEYYSAIKKNEIMPFAAIWTDLEIIIISEVSQKEKDKYCVIFLICGI